MPLTANGYLPLREFDRHFDRARFRFVPVFGDTSAQETRLADFPGLPGIAVLSLPDHRAAIFVVFPTGTIFHAIPRHSPSDVELRYYFTQAPGPAKNGTESKQAAAPAAPDCGRPEAGNHRACEGNGARPDAGPSGPRAVTDRRASEGNPAKARRIFTICDEEDDD